MTSKRYTEEFKIEAVKHVTDRGYSVAEVAERLGTTTNSLYAWMRQYGEPHPQQANRTDDQAEIAKLKADWPAAGRTAARGYTGDMREAGETCSVHRVARIVREACHQ